MKTDELLEQLEREHKRCSDGCLFPTYAQLLEQLQKAELTQELVDYLCFWSTSQKHFWEIRFQHLRVLLLNPSAQKYDLKSFYLDRLTKCRRLALKMFFIRGYAMYASEKELIPVMKRFCASMEKNHDYIDYNYLLSAAGLPYFVKTYGYPCFQQALRIAETESRKVYQGGLGCFTITEDLRQKGGIFHGERTTI